MIWTMKCKYATTDFKECTPEEMPKRGEGVTGKTVSDLESGGGLLTSRKMKAGGLSL